MSRIHFFVVVLLLAISASAVAQTSRLDAGTNVNMVSGTSWPDGDPFLQRQNEPSIAVSTRNPLHLLAGANDYRTVDVPGDLGIDETGDVWMGIFRSLDGGKTWKSTLLPGCPYATSVCTSDPLSPLRGYTAAADPTIRAGHNGLFFVNGIAFNRGTNALGVIFVSRYIDDNNKENGNPIRYVSTSVIDNGTSGQFLDKPWIGADIPRAGGGSCTIPASTDGKTPAQTFPAGNVYLVYSMFTGSEAKPTSKIMLSRSLDCGTTWSNPIKVSESNSKNQGTSLAIDPISGAVYVAWRRSAASSETDAIMVVKSTDGGRTFNKAVEAATFAPGVAFDQPKISSTTNFRAQQFRAKAFPVIAVDGRGRVYVAWSQRGFASGSDSRIVVKRSADGVRWNDAPVAADPAPGVRGHQLMPAMAFAGGRLFVAYYDNRDDHTKGVLALNQDGTYSETRVPTGNRATGQTNLVFPNDLTTSMYDGTTGLSLRHSIDVRSAMADVSGNGPLAFSAAGRVSQYKYGVRPDDAAKSIQQLEFNPPNLPMFSKGTASFLGDYIDVTVPFMVPKAGGGWTFNTTEPGQAAFHVTWTDNRNVRPPADGNWGNFTPVGSTGGASVYQTGNSPACVVGQSGMRNQNIYTSVVTQGPVITALGSEKPLSTSLTRTFTVTVQNQSPQQRAYTLAISRPAGSFASFDPLAEDLDLNVNVAPRSSATRLVFVKSATTNTAIQVTATEVATSVVARAYLNPDIVNPDIVQPDIVRGVVNPDIATAEVYTPDIAVSPFVAAFAAPDIAAPDIVAPDIASPDIVAPDIVAPDIVAPDIVAPDIVAPDIVAPDIVAPDIVAPDIVAPDIAAPDIAAGYSDNTWTVSNNGNTSSGYTMKLYNREPINLCPAGCVGNACPAGCVKMSLYLHKRYLLPTAKSELGKPGCTLIQETQDQLVVNAGGPQFTEFEKLDESSATNPDIANATVSLAPGEVAQVTLRQYGPPSTVDLASLLTPVAVSQGNFALTNVIKTLVIKSLTPPDGLKGVPYSGQIVTSGAIGTTTVEYAIVSGALPAGLTLNPDGTITGTPTATGNVVLKVTVKDNPAQGLTRTAVANLRLRIGDVLAPPPSSFALPLAIPGQPYNVDLNNAIGGGLPPVTWSIVTGSLAGTGLTLSPDGVISGTPIGFGTITFTVKAVDSACIGSSCAPQTITFSLLLNSDNTPPVIVPTVTGTVGTQGWYRSDVAVSWAVSDPETNITSSSGCGAVTLSAETAGQVVTCTATNGAGVTFSNSVTIKIDKTAPTATITTPPANATYAVGATVNSAYTCADSAGAARSGISTCTGTVANGARIDTATAGAKTFSVTATDLAGNQTKVDRTYSVGYTFVGFATPLQPAGPNSYSGEISTGQAVPIKFQLLDSRNRGLTDLSFVKNISVVFNGTTPATGACPVSLVGPVTLLYMPTVGATGGSTFRTSGGSYIFNWDTTTGGVSGPGCYTVFVQANDGSSERTTSIRFK